jgi:hypothetical protein
LQEVRTSWSYLSHISGNAAKGDKGKQADGDIKVGRLMATYWTDFAKVSS